MVLGRGGLFDVHRPLMRLAKVRRITLPTIRSKLSQHFKFKYLRSDNRRESDMDSPETRFMAAAHAFGIGDAKEAEKLLAPLIKAYPNHPDISHLSGAIALKLGQPADAERALRRALGTAASAGRAEIRPALLGLLGSSLRRLGRTEEAIAALRQSLALHPNSADTRYNLGNLLVETSQLHEAAKHYAAALQFEPSALDIRLQLGYARMAIGDIQGAISDFEQAKQQDPQQLDVIIGLGTACLSFNRYRDAAENYLNAIKIAPDHAQARANLGVALLHLGQPEDAVFESRRAVSLDPNDPVNHSKLIHHLHYVEADGAALLAEARLWEKRHAKFRSAKTKPHANSADPARRLRIGYVSTDFRRHPVGYSLKSVLPAHDKNAVEIFCYANNAAEDDLTLHFKSVADEWRNVAGVKDEAFADIIREDGIDILVDLAGHTGDHRLLAFARRPAPIQVTAIGGSGTTGLTAIDYIVTDVTLVPPGFECFYAEEVVRLKDSWICYTPPTTAPPVAPPPSTATGRVTFGSFNNFGKLSFRTLELWAQVLERTPESCLLLKGWAVDSKSDRERFTARAVAAGIDSTRIILEPGSSYEEYLAAYKRVDIALDPTPFSGGLTSLDALWMGVPLLTQPGQSFASRYSAAHLANIGLRELIVDDAERYVALATELAVDLPRLQTLRSGLRDRIAAAPLCDGKRYARNLETAYRTMWRAWCGGRRNPLDPA